MGCFLSILNGLVAGCISGRRVRLADDVSSDPSLKFLASPRVMMG